MGRQEMRNAKRSNDRIKAALKECYDKGYNNGYNTCYTQFHKVSYRRNVMVMALVLHRKLGFGKKRLLETFQEINRIAGDDTRAWDEIMAQLEAETGIGQEIIDLLNDEFDESIANQKPLIDMYEEAKLLEGD